MLKDGLLNEIDVETPITYKMSCFTNLECLTRGLPNLIMSNCPGLTQYKESEGDYENIGVTVVRGNIDGGAWPS